MESAHTLSMKYDAKYTKYMSLILFQSSYIL